MNSADKIRIRHGVRVLSSTDSTHVAGELQRIGLDRQQAATEDDWARLFVLMLQRLPERTAVVLKEKLTAAGAHFAVSPKPAGDLSMIVTGSRVQFENLNSSGDGLPAPLPAILQSFLAVISDYSKTDFVVPYPGGELDLSEKTAIMGVVNVTPDSFSDGGDFFSNETALKYALRLAEAGADIIDIGGESTRPGSDPVSASEEIRRVVPVIETLNSKVSIPISIDTYKPDVARKALEAGAKIVNDVTGLRENPEMAEVAAEFNVPLVVMHMKGKPKTMQDNPAYEDLISEIYDSLARSAQAASIAGIKPEKLIVDPGIGFGKSFEDNLVILDRLHEFRSLGLPICIGVSRKSFLGATLGIPEPKKRLIGSLSASAVAARGGAKVIRVHDVSEAVEALKVVDAIAANKLPQEA